jgi:hypothetical protein
VARKEIDVSKLLGDVPELEELELVSQTEPLKGSRFRLSWDGSWEADGPFIRIEDLPREIVLNARLGQVRLGSARLTRAGGDEPLAGNALDVVLDRAAVEDAPLFRCYVQSDKHMQRRVCFPEWVRDSSSGREWAGLLPLELDGKTLDVYFVQDGPFIVFEGLRDSLVQFTRHTGAARLMLTYLTAQTLYRRSCDVILSNDGANVAQIHWYSGRDGESTIYSPIPVSWPAAGEYRMSRSLPLGGKVLVPEVLSRCVQKLLDERELETPIFYIGLALDSPVEVRGALLSVALESLTTHFKNKGLISYSSPVPDGEWPLLRVDLLAALAARAVAWPADQRDQILAVLTARINNSLNAPTNRTKLTEPFKALRVPLTDEEAEAIDKRNRLLHSGRLVAPTKLDADPDAWREAYVTEMRMLTAVNKLLLKYLGYSGAVFDWGAQGLNGPTTFTEI